MKILRMLASLHQHICYIMQNIITYNQTFRGSFRYVARVGVATYTAPLRPSHSAAASFSAKGLFGLFPAAAFFSSLKFI